MPRLAPLVFCVLAFVSACRRESRDSGRWVRCSCAYLTDRDGAGRVDLDLCAAEPVVSETAQSCAQGLGLGMVNDCDCGKPEREPCPVVGRCREAP